MLLIPITWGNAVAQVTAGNNIVTIGGTYDDDADFTAVVGLGFPAVGRVWALPYVNAGEYGSLSAEFALLFGSHEEGFYIGPTLGPGVDFEQIPGDVQALVAYMVAAGGIVAGFDLSDKWGAWGHARYKFAFDNLDGEQTFYQDGWLAGLGFFRRFNF